MAILMGCVVGRASTEISRASLNQNKSTFLPLLVKVVMVGMIASCLWATYESCGVESRKRATRNLSLLNEFKTPLGRLASDSSFHKTKTLLERAIKIRPDDSAAHFQMGEYHLARYRVEAATNLNERMLAELEANTSSTAPEKIPIDEIWATTAPATVHREYRLALRGNRQLATRIQQDELIGKHWPSAWEEFKLAEQLCPYQSGAQYRLAELSAFFGSDEAAHINKSLERTLLNTRLMFSCGLLSMNSGDQKKAVELWAKCLKNPNSKPYERTIIEICQVELPMKSFYEEVLPQTPKELINIASKYFEHPDMILPKRLLLDHTMRVIDKAELSELERNFFSAEASRMSDDFKPAAEFYRKALELDSTQVGWRFNYAKCLHETKQYDEAIRQLKKCELESLSANPNINRLLKRIRSDRATRN